MRAQLKEQKQDRPRFRDAGTHSNVFRHVILGKESAGGSSIAALNREPEEVRSQLRIIHKTPDLPAFPLVAHPRVSESLREAVTEAILRFAGDKEGRSMLRGIRMSGPSRADYRKDYLPLERLGLERYVVKGE